MNEVSILSGATLVLGVMPFACDERVNGFGCAEGTGFGIGKGAGNGTDIGSGFGGGELAGVGIDASDDAWPRA